VKAKIACICGIAHEVNAPTGSTRCTCGRVVVLERDVRTPRNVRPWCDENGVDYPANYAAPEVTGWTFEAEDD
jgi:hypothetical protein